MSINQDDVGKIISIRYRGKVYDHYGILDGQGGVIHVHKKKGMITVDSLERMLVGAKSVAYLDDDFDVRWNQYEHAKSLIGSSHQYRFFTDNCETWVQKIRTGEAFSPQVERLTQSASIILLGIGILYGFK